MVIEEVNLGTGEDSALSFGKKIGYRRQLVGILFWHLFLVFPLVLTLINCSSALSNYSESIEIAIVEINFKVNP